MDEYSEEELQELEDKANNKSCLELVGCLTLIVLGLSFLGIINL